MGPPGRPAEGRGRHSIPDALISDESRAPPRPTSRSATTALDAHPGPAEDDSPDADQELRDELMTLLVAGHETTATALAWAMDSLRVPALSPARDEIDAGEDAYLDAVVKEMLRLRP